MTPEQATRVLAAAEKLKLKIVENRNHYNRYENAVNHFDQLMKRSFYSMWMRQVGNRNLIDNLIEEYRYTESYEKPEIWSRLEAVISEYE